MNIKKKESFIKRLFKEGKISKQERNKLLGQLLVLAVVSVENTNIEGL